MLGFLARKVRHRAQMLDRGFAINARVIAVVIDRV
jgi:hypothetical protein